MQDWLRMLTGAGICSLRSLVNESGEETPLKAGDLAFVNPDEKHQYCNKGISLYK